MKRTWITVVAVFLGVTLLSGLTATAYAQEEKKAARKAAAAKEDRVSGTVHMINKDTSTITVRENRTNAMRQVVYTPDTKFTKVNKPGGSIDEIKEGTRVICLGKFDEKTRLVASRIDVRLPR